MALIHGKVNPLNVLGIRKVTFPAHHFAYTCIQKWTPYETKKIDRWIYQNLNGRYYIGQHVELVDNVIVYTTKIGFEQESDLVYFMFACPDLPHNKN